jgi:hypothetical protein
VSTGLYSGVSGLALGTGLYKGAQGLWGGSSGLIDQFGATLSLNFLAGAPLDSRITFSRTTNATLVDSTGRVTYAPNNLFTNSEAFENVAWVKGNSTVTVDATVAPNGTTTADKLVENTATTTHQITQQTAFVVGTSYTWSFYVKAAERSVVRVLFPAAAFTSNLVANFDLATGAWRTGSPTPSAGLTLASQDAGNGWYRISATATATASLNQTILLLMVDTPSGTGNYTGNGTSGLFIWGAQLEAVTYQTLPSTYVQTVASAYYGPRFDYNPVTLAPRGLLIEEQRANLALYSEQFDNAAWVKSFAAVTANATTSPDGTTNADRFTADGSSNTHAAQQTVTYTAAAHTFTAYAKRDTNNFVQLRFGAAAIAGGTGFANFDLNAGTVGTIGAGLSAASITPAGNGWYRCTITGTTAATSTVIGFYVVASATAPSAEVNSLATSVFLYGAQLEVGAFATSYIPTVASTVTRAADLAVMTGANFSSWYNQSEGTIIAQFVATTNGFNSTSGNAFLFVYDIDSAAATNSGHSLLLSGGYGPGWRGSTSILGVDQAAFQAAMTLGNTTVRKIAYAYRTNDFAASANGGAATTDTSGNLPTNDRMTIGAQNATAGSNTVTGYMQRITYYPTRLTDAQLQALTT